MQDRGLSNPQRQTLLLSASVHQARQPLFILQNTLFAASYLTQRMEASPDLKLIRQSLIDMRAAVDRLSSTISVIATIAKPENRKPAETVVSDFLKETFQIITFCLQRGKETIKCEIVPIPSNSNLGSVLMDYANVQIALIQWILDTLPDAAFCDSSGHAEAITLSAFQNESDVTIQIRSDNHQKQIRLGHIISTVADRPPLQATP